MDKSSHILLSICIPTYNRSKFLERTLESIVNQDAFNEDVEIVISDNCSNDDTQESVANFIQKHKNIRYSLNKVNIGDGNFNKALSLGTGEYLKLMNDTIILQPGALKEILGIIKKFSQEKLPLFFYNNNERHTNNLIKCAEINHFVDTTSFYVGWIANFGAWKIHFENIKNKSRMAFLQLMQVDWSLRIVEGRKSIVVFGNWIRMQQLDKKGGYNFFEIHVDNYLFIYQTYINNGSLRKKVFSKEKNRLLWNFLADWLYLIVLQKDQRYAYDTTGWKQVLWRHYKYNPLLLIAFSKQMFKHLIHLKKK